MTDFSNLKLWVTSDFHFNHDKDFIYAPRGFKTVEEMNEEMIKRFNSVVGEYDYVFILGDLCMSGKLEENKELIESLNGNLWIVSGNHDTDKRMGMYRQCKNVCAVSDSVKRFKYKGYHFYCSHYPTLVGNYDDKGLKQAMINLCGHTHTQDKYVDFKNGLIYHVEMDAHDCYPVLLDDIIEELKNKNKGE